MYRYNTVAVESLSDGTKYSRVSPGIGVGRALAETPSVRRLAGGSSSLPVLDEGVGVGLVSFEGPAMAGLAFSRLMIAEVVGEF